MLALGLSSAGGGQKEGHTMVSARCQERAERPLCLLSPQGEAGEEGEEGEEHAAVPGREWTPKL